MKLSNLQFSSNQVTLSLALRANNFELSKLIKSWFCRISNSDFNFDHTLKFGLKGFENGLFRFQVLCIMSRHDVKWRKNVIIKWGERCLRLNDPHYYASSWIFGNEWKISVGERSLGLCLWKFWRRTSFWWEKNEVSENHFFSGY